MLVKDSDFYCGNSSGNPMQLALLKDIPSTSVESITGMHLWRRVSRIVKSGYSLSKVSNTMIFSGRSNRSYAQLSVGKSLIVDNLGNPSLADTGELRQGEYCTSSAYSEYWRLLAGTFFKINNTSGEYSGYSALDHSKIYYIPENATITADFSNSSDVYVSELQVVSTFESTFDAEDLISSSKDKYQEYSTDDGYLSYIGKYGGSLRSYTRKYVGNGNSKLKLDFPYAPIFILLVNSSSGSYFMTPIMVGVYWPDSSGCLYFKWDDLFRSLTIGVSDDSYISSYNASGSTYVVFAIG